MRTLLMLAFRNLWQAKRRTLLLGSAIAFVALLFLSLRAISQSVSARLIESATSLSAGHVNVGGFFKVRKTDPIPLVVDRAKVLSFVKEQVPEATAIIDRHGAWGRLISPASSMNLSLRGIVLEDEERLLKTLQLAKEKDYKKDGRDQVFGNFNDLRKPNSIILFAAQAKKLEVNVGDVVTYITEASGGETNTVDLQVVAIAEDLGFMSNFSGFIPRETALNLYRLDPDTTGTIMVYLESPEQSTAVMERLRKAFLDNGYRVLDHDPIPFFMKFEKLAGKDWLGQQIDLTIWSDEVSFILWVTTALDFLSFLVVSILGTIIVGGVMNAMWMSVRERTKEIGTMRAIGSQKGFVVGLFVYEAILLGFLAALSGIVLGVCLLNAINAMDIPVKDDGLRIFLMANTLHFDVQASQIFSTLGLFSFITGIAAIYPAWKASRLRPVDALLQGK